MQKFHLWNILHTVLFIKSGMDFCVKYDYRISSVYIKILIPPIKLNPCSGYPSRIKYLRL